MQLFAATGIDGRPIANASSDSHSASWGQGYAMSVVLTTRRVPARAMRIKLLGTHQTAAPIHEIASRAAGTFFSVEGVVDFQPEGGRHYIVKGELKKAGSSVWIEDRETGRVVTEKVVGK
ncbi:hypothetical protein ISF6_4194 [Piscinibacter sakaiensis]|uniref:Uncharacterized protein n=1 Tax=Piscinibacter sakaiensis TaxID=1547922 RepID=A0A0K8P704_PISS1|nr:hypothetical protein ISF6_4194 [Piscinibacter sakaiensis]